MNLKLKTIVVVADLLADVVPQSDDEIANSRLEGV